MTALTMSARPGEDDASLRPLPWRRMAGITWRQHQVALAGVAALLGALTIWLWIAGTHVHDTYAALIACHPASSPGCQGLADTFNGTWTVMSIPAILLQLVPALIGAFTGAPVLARELETGTFRFAWTQGFERWRWALAKLVALAVVLAAVTFAFSALVSWSYQPYLGTSNQDLGVYGNSPLVTVFSLREVAFPAWTVAVFAIGALAGMLIRRVVPAIVAALAVYAGLAIAAAAFLREHYLAPLVISNQNAPGSAWIIGQWWTKNGRFAFAGNPPLSLLSHCSFPQGGPFGKGGGVAGGGGPSSVNPFAQCLAPHGYAQWNSFQPASRFWTFQWIEGGWLLALSVLLIGAAIWLVHHRAAL
jgi:ABC-type transport system involved in multi-copper enzyme maturation permease subunit